MQLAAVDPIQFTISVCKMFADVPSVIKLPQALFVVVI